MHKTTLYLPDDLKIEVKTVSKTEQRSEAEVMRNAIREYVDKRLQTPWPQSVGMISDGTFDPAEDEKYLKEHWKPDW